MTKLRAAIVGLGNVGVSKHLPALLSSHEITVTAVCDTNAALMRCCANTLGVAGFTGIDKLLDKCRPDVAIVAVPHDKHGRIARVLAEAGVGFIKEKPLARSMSEALELIDVIKRHRGKMLISMPRRFTTTFKVGREMLGAIGQVTSFRMSFIKAIGIEKAGWRAHLSSAGGGCLLDMGYHSVDLLVWYFGVPDEIAAVMSNKEEDGISAEVEHTCRMKCIYRSPGRCEVSGEVYVSRVGSRDDEWIEVIGTDGELVVRREGVTLRRHVGNRNVIWPNSGLYDSPWSEQIRYFTKRFLKQTTVPIHTYQGHLQVLSIIEAAYKSVEANGPVIPSNEHREVLYV